MNHESRRDFLKIAAISVALGCAPEVLGATITPNQGTELSRQFFRAIQSDNLSDVRKLLKNHPDLLTARDEHGRTGYAQALLAGHREIGTHLRESGYESDLHESALALDWKRFDELSKSAGEQIVTRINADHPIGGTTMYAAAAGGAGSDIWRVYAVCGDPNTTPRKAKGVTPLQRALLFPDLAVAEITAATLLSNDASPNSGSNTEAPPLHIASGRGSHELVEMLIRHGADVDARDSKGKTASQTAAAAGHLAIQKRIDQHQTLPRTCHTSRTAYDVNGSPYSAPDISDIPLPERRFLVGQSHGNLAFVQKAIKENSRLVHSVATTGEICVEACAHTGRIPVVDFLLENGAPYSLPTAVVRGDQESAKRLLEEDPNRIHERGAHDFALLWYPVIGGGNVEMMKFLLDRGARIEEQHFLGTTALHWACMRGPIELVELLIDHKADVNRVSRKFRVEGETPLQLARRSNQEKIAEMLTSRGAV